jgi:hypothetical protein
MKSSRANGHVARFCRRCEGTMLGPAIFRGRVAGGWAAHGGGFVGEPNRAGVEARQARLALSEPWRKQSGMCLESGVGFGATCPSGKRCRRRHFGNSEQTFR